MRVTKDSLLLYAVTDRSWLDGRTLYSQVEEALEDDADDVSYDTLRAICEAVSIPVVAIGGISQSNVMQLRGSGICGIAVISAIFAQKDIKAATKKLKEITKEMVAGTGE